ncbi:MAG: BACON domain-containing protein [Anaerolineae bacterium]|nr:BACON domain-containing protein [Anaerolineae bacterium]
MSFKYAKSIRFGSFLHRSLSLIVLLMLSGNQLAMALPVMSPEILEPASPAILPAAEDLALSPAALPDTDVAGNVRSLPADVTALPELVTRRTADSATFQAGEDRYVTIMGTEAMHYQDQKGAWQVIDPAFHPVENAFVVEHNAIRSRIALSETRLAMAAGSAGVAWQATALGAIRGKRFISLARALDEPPTFAQKRDEDRVLRYEDNWSDPSLSEEIVSAPNSLEHLLILSEPPQVWGKPAYLEMQATLKLLFGAELWAHGQVQTETFQTTGGLEIRDAAGNVALVFDPILAFEQQRPAFAVAGSYVARPSGEPNTWIIGVRTPWDWWVDPSRQYPAVIDPTIHVLKPTGYSNGMAWVANPTGANPDTPDSNLQFGKMVLGSWYNSGQYQNFVQFNSMPFLLSNDPVSLTAAYLDIEPSYLMMPYYSESEVDWEMLQMQQNVKLYNLGQCPGNCGGFSLTTAPSGFNWNNVPQGTLIGTLPVAAPPAKGGGQTVTTTWDVSNIVRTWNQQTPRPADGPAFRLVGDTNCPYESFNGDYAYGIPQCVRLVVPPGGARLRIEYEALPLLFNQNYLNFPGVPSFSEGVFENTGHQYDLTITAGADHWRAVAARGNHAITPGLPTWTGLKLLDYGGTNPVELVNGTVQKADRTAVVLMDDHNPDNTLGAADLKVEVTASNQNPFVSDADRNYRIEYQRANSWSVAYSTWTTRTISFNTMRLVTLGEFDLEYGDSVLIRVTAPVTFPLEAALAAPTSGADKADSALGNVNLDNGFEPDNVATRSKEMTFVQTRGTWALALINQGRPVPDPIRPSYGIAHEVTVEILRCSMGSIATAKWDCQPVPLPKGNTDSATGLGVTVYSEGGFTGDPDSDTWCTTNEGSGTPFIGPDVDGRWIVVGQGTVCRNGDVISTTADSGIGLAISNPITPTRGKILPTFAYGSTSYYPLPDGYPTGVVIHSGDSGQLVPEENIRRNLKPFDEYWGTVLTAADDYLSTADMMLVGNATLDVPVTVDSVAAPEALSFAIPWTLYPSEPALYDYVFDARPTQSPALPQPAIMASLELRIIDAGGADVGLVEQLDTYKMEANVNAGQFRADKGKVTQDAKLGGATKNAVIVIQPPGMTRLPANEKSCAYEGASTSCLDLRRDDYMWDNGNGDKNLPPWELPDVHVEDSAGLMMFSRPGELQIFSADHPLAKANMEQSFSFDTFGASVSVTEEPCTEGGPVVTVVKGSASIGLPSMGDDGSSGAPSITTNFKLCSAKLRQAQLILEIPTPGIPVGSTGVGVNLIGGTVIIDPDYTQIEFQLGFQTLDGVTLSHGLGAVMIDTRGLFQLEASGTIVGILNAELLLQVAWNPMDVLLEAGVSCCGNLIRGGLRLHAWIGQGWQHMYPWLPDNDDFHFTGSIQATLTIPEGYIADLGILELPPFTFSIGVKIAFGEFCTNASCTDYDWGMSGVVTVCGYSVGLYVDSGGPELILGSDDHVLIDQFGGSVQMNVVTSMAPAAPTPPLYEVQSPGTLQPHLFRRWITSPVKTWPVESAAGYGCTGAGTPVHVCPFEVAEGAGRALFSVSWENGGLDVTLITPDATVISPSNAMAYGVTVSETNTALLRQVSFGVPQAAIMSGTWQLQMSGVITDPADPYQTNYQILFTTEPPPPALVWNSPVVTGTTPDAGGMVNLAWTALRAGQPLSDEVKMELVYVPVASKPVTPTEISGTLIVNQIAANVGSYAWDTEGLASGEYAVGGRIDDHRNANGHVFAWAPGTVVVTDTTPPPVPHILAQIDQKDALIVIWERDDVTRDLAGYLVEYTIPEWNELGQLPKVRRVHPHPADEWPWFERIRLGGLLTGLPTTVCVRAYDASFNVSDCEEFTHTLHLDFPPLLGAPQRPGSVGGTLNKETILRVTWWWPDVGTPTGYFLSYQPSGCMLPGVDTLADQGSSPIDVMNTRIYTLTGLTKGQTYRIAINGYTAQGYVGPAAEEYAIFIDSTDANADGLPDDWAELYHLFDGAAGDKDGDGLTNGEEFVLRSNPVRADSDRDGYDDGEEAEWGTDLCGVDHPPYHSRPKLTLVGNGDLSYAAAINQEQTTPQKFSILNLGGGTLHWEAVASDPWIVVNQESGIGMNSLYVNVDAGDLTPGRYTGTLKIRSVSPVTLALQSRTAGLPEEAVINVELKVLPPKVFIAPVYLPLILR